MQNRISEDKPKRKLKQKGNKFKTDIGKYCFAHRIVEQWNKFVISIEDSYNSVTVTFEDRQDKHLKKLRIQWVRYTFEFLTHSILITLTISK